MHDFIAGLFTILCGLFIVVNLYIIARDMRRQREEEDEDGGD